MQGLLIILTDRYAIGDVVIQFAPHEARGEHESVHTPQLRGLDGQLTQPAQRPIRAIENLTKTWVAG